MCPILEYSCKKCNKIFESIEKSDTKEIKCFQCGEKCSKVFPSKMSFKLNGKWFKEGY